MAVDASLKKPFLMCAALFALGVAVGALPYARLLPRLLPALKLGMGAAEKIASSGGLEAALIIFLKNASVAILCLLLGRPTRGLFPGLVCFINGCVVGFIGAVLSGFARVAWWRYAAALLPHGVVELPAIFLACAVGTAALERRRKLSLAKYPLMMLAVAACIEVWVSALVADRMI